VSYDGRTNGNLHKTTADPIMNVSEQATTKCTAENLSGSTPSARSRSIPVSLSLLHAHSLTCRTSPKHALLASARHCLVRYSSASVQPGPQPDHSLQSPNLPASAKLATRLHSPGPLQTLYSVLAFAPSPSRPIPSELGSKVHSRTLLCSSF